MVDVTELIKKEPYQTCYTLGECDGYVKGCDETALEFAKFIVRQKFPNAPDNVVEVHAKAWVKKFDEWCEQQSTQPNHTRETAEVADKSENREPYISYGKITDLEDGNELWSEPVTDTRDGLVIRNQNGSIVTTYLEQERI